MERFTEGYVIAKRPNDNMGKLLVTGGAGFIGSALAKKALEMGWSIRIVDTAVRSHFDSDVHHKSASIETIQGDIRNKKIMEEAIIGCDAVVHLAAQVSVPVSVLNPEETMDINVEGTAQVIALCQRFGVKRLIIASSAAVYGDVERFPLKEKDAGRTLSPYALSKWTNEMQIIEARNGGLDAAACRFFNVYGAGQKVEGSYAAVIPKFIEQMVNGTSPQINGDGFQTRDFIHVNDVVTAILTMLDGDWKAQQDHVFNVATQTEISLNELVHVINKAIMRIRPSHKLIHPVYGSARDGDIRFSVADIERIKTTFGWKPNVMFEDGILDMVRQRIGRGE